jgi:hypothetical protein
MTIGYFGQDVGEISGQSAVAAVMDQTASTATRLDRGLGAGFVAGS